MLATSVDSADVSAVSTVSTAQGDKPPGSPGFSDAHNCPVLINPVLSFIKAFRLKGDKETLKGIVVERFSSAAVESAKTILWNSCESHLLSGGLEFHNRRHSDKRSQLDANLNDLYKHFSVLILFLPYIVRLLIY